MTKLRCTINKNRQSNYLNILGIIYFCFDRVRNSRSKHIQSSVTFPFDKDS